MVYIIPAPEPGMPGTPYFAGQEVTKFFIQWKGFCKRYGFLKEESFARLPDYCEESIRVLIEANLDYMARDWPRF